MKKNQDNCHKKFIVWIFKSWLVRFHNPRNVHYESTCLVQLCRRLERNDLKKRVLLFLSSKSNRKNIYWLHTETHGKS